MTEEKSSLIEKVRGFDPEAAAYLESDAPLLPSYDGEAITLPGLFLFEETPQGFEYWNILHERLFYEGGKSCPHCGKTILL